MHNLTDDIPVIRWNFDSEYEAEAWLEMTLEEIAKRHDGTVEINYEDRTFSFECPKSERLALAEDLSKTLKGFEFAEV